MGQMIQSLHYPKVYTKLLILLLSVAIIPALAISALSYQVSINNAKQQAQTYSSQLLMQVQGSNDILYEQVQGFANELLLNFQRYSEVMRRAPYTPDILSFLNEMRTKKAASSQNVLSFTLIDPGSQKVFSSVNNSLNTFDEYEDKQLLDMTEEDSHTQIMNDFYPRTTISGEGVISYRVRYPLPEHAYGYIVVDIAMHKFLSSDLVGNEQYGHILMKNAKNMLLNVNQAPIAKRLEKKEEAQRYYIIESRSGLSGLQYAYVIPKERINRNNQRLLISILFMSFLTILLGVVVAWLSSRNIYTPFRRLLHNIREMVGDQPSQNKEMNEFGYLQHAFTKMNDQKTSYWSALKTNQSLFKQKQMLLLLSGNMQAYDSITAPPDFLLQFPHSTFRILVMELEDAEGFEKRFTPVEQELMMYAMENIAEEVLANSSSAYVSALDKHRLVALINRDPCMEKETEDAMYESLKARIAEYLKLTISIGIGNTQDELSKIRSSYEQALNALHYRIYLGKGMVISYNRITEDGHETRQSAVSWSEEKERIKIYLQSGNWDSLESHIQNLADESGHLHMSVADLHLFYLNYVSCMTQVGTEISIHIADTIEDEMTFGQRLARLTTLEDLKVNMLELCQQLFRQMEKKKGNIHHEMIDKVLDYLRNHLNSNLSMEMLAERVHMHPSYLSKICKDITGKTLGEQIVDARMNKARELLVQTSASVQDISLMVGYTNPRAFYRMFKKYTGLTPGEFQKLEDVKGFH